MSIILGVNAFHADSSACIIKNNVLIAAVEEERFTRVKHWAGFPCESIQYCMKEAGVSLEQVDVIALNRDPQANFGRKIIYTLFNFPSLKLILNRLKNAKEWATIENEIHRAFPQSKFSGKVVNVEHHTAHLASAYFASSYQKAAVLSVDGFGDFASTAWGAGVNGELSVDAKIYFPHSLGIFYQALTQFLGFPNYGDEYKVMGLAPYGKPVHMDKMEKILLIKSDGTFELNLKYFKFQKENIQYEWKDGSPVFGKLYSPELLALLGPDRQSKDELTQYHKDLARSLQTMYEKALFSLLNMLFEKYKYDSLCIAGGCGNNSVANGKIAQNTPFKNIYIQSAAGDAGGAIGAAYTVIQNGETQKVAPPMEHALWGPSYGQSEIEDILNEKKSEIEKSSCSISLIEDVDILCEKTAAAIADGKVIGWYQGRLEWGPRALGNRSILCDPRRTDMQDILNRKIKRRESFRPFAPSIIREAVKEWFIEDGEVPFMMKVFGIKDEKQKLIPAVTHVDGSGRLQTVYKETNSLYHKLISKFMVITGVPMVLNTSFNENEPIVCNPNEALDCFLRTKMDVLVLGNYYLSRSVDQQFIPEL
jgi:carbamoyltransferase